MQANNDALALALAQLQGDTVAPILPLPDVGWQPARIVSVDNPSQTDDGKIVVWVTFGFDGRADVTARFAFPSDWDVLGRAVSAPTREVQHFAGKELLVNVQQFARKDGTQGIGIQTYTVRPLPTAGTVGEVSTSYADYIRNDDVSDVLSGL